jgi:hypothetical protein
VRAAEGWRGSPLRSQGRVPGALLRDGRHTLVSKPHHTDVQTSTMLAHKSLGPNHVHSSPLHPIQPPPFTPGPPNTSTRPNPPAPPLLHPPTHPREHSPSIIFMDEVDSIGSARMDNSGGGGDRCGRQAAAACCEPGPGNSARTEGCGEACFCRDVPAALPRLAICITSLSTAARLPAAAPHLPLLASFPPPLPSASHTHTRTHTHVHACAHLHCPFAFQRGAAHHAGAAQPAGRFRGLKQDQGARNSTETRRRPRLAACTFWGRVAGCCTQRGVSFAWPLNPRPGLCCVSPRSRCGPALDRNTLQLKA